MKVFPDTKLYIISGCPCDPDYEHTLYWPNKEGQHAYFMTKAKYRLDAMSYQRAKRGRIRVQYKVEDLYDCNYIAFQNSAFGNKWFYAFIDDVTYVNNITSEISYTIDVIQTWITDMGLQQCFVTREHSVTDVAGENLMPEEVQTGDLVSMTGYKSIIPKEGSLGACVAVTGKADGSVQEGFFYGNLYSQAKYYHYTAPNMGAMKDLLTELNILNNQNAVTSVFMCPSNLLIDESATPNSSAVQTYALDQMSTLKRSDNTPVRNKKLNTFPYTCLEVLNCSGDSKQFAYEYFAPWQGIEHNPRVTIYRSMGRTLSLTLSPSGYKTLGLSTNFNELMTYQFPEITWATSNFANRALMEMLSLGVGALTGGLQGGLPGALIGGAVGAMQGKMSGQVNTSTNIPYADLPFPSVGAREDMGGARVERSSAIAGRAIKAQAETMIELATTPIRPLASTTRMGNNADILAGGNYGFYYTQLAPLPQYIDRIDDYFSRYGYKTNQIKTPNISSRPHWNYVQTVGCKIGGSIPCTDEKLICSIFDKGVTFWKHPEEVGNFSLDNSPT